MTSLQQNSVLMSRICVKMGTSIASNSIKLIGKILIFWPPVRKLHYIYSCKRLDSLRNNTYRGTFSAHNGTSFGGGNKRASSSIKIRGAMTKRPKAKPRTGPKKWDVLTDNRVPTFWASVARQKWHWKLGSTSSSFILENTLINFNVSDVELP